MPGEMEKVYFDSCIFIDWLDATSPSDRVSAVQSLLDKWKAKKLEICTSSVTMIEVLQSSNNPTQFDKFKQLRGSEGITWLECNRRVAEWASEVRTDLLLRKKNGEFITTSTPDSIHIATALLHGCSILYTRDGVSSTENPKDKESSRKLIPLSPYRYNHREIEIKAPCIEPLDQPLLPEDN